MSKLIRSKLQLKSPKEEPKVKKAVLIATVLILIIGTTAVWSVGRPGPGGGGPGCMSCPAMAVMPPQAPMLDRIADALQLTEDQVAKLKDILTNGDATIRPLMQTAAEASKALHAAVLASNYDEQKVKDLAVKAEKAEAAVVDASIDVWAQIRTILKADQIKALQETMSAPPQRPEPGRRPMGGPMGQHSPLGL